MATKGNSFRGLDMQELEGGIGGGMGGAGGRYTPSGKKSFDATKDASDTLVKGLGIPLMAAGAGAGIKKLNDQQNEYDKARNSTVEKTSTDRAREAAKEESIQRKTNKAAEAASKDMGMKKGGMVSSASRRADGCATKGKTRGKVL
jgi:hypothetical protein